MKNLSCLWMWRLTLARGVLFLLSAEYSAVMCWAWPGTIVTWPWLRLSMIYCCALRLWSQICVTCRRYWFLDSVALSCCTAQDASGPRDGCIRTRWLRSISLTKILVWLLQNAGFCGVWCETEPLCVQSLPQP